MKIAVLGAGWFGCHIAVALRADGHEVTVFDPNGVFSGASGNNQDRVHLGFHYPRSAKTRDEIRASHDRFVETYPTVGVKENLFAISLASCIDFLTYLAICRSARLDFCQVDPAAFGITNVEGAVATAERVVDTPAVRRLFEEKLRDVWRMKEAIVEYLTPGGVRINSEWFDVAVNCTNLRYGTAPLPVYHEAAVLLEVRGPVGLPSIAVMDGQFPALLQTAEPGLYTLSHVTHTAIAKCDTYPEARAALDALDWRERAPRFITALAEYHPSAARQIKAVGARFAVRTKPRNGTDSRECLSHVDGRVMTIVCGKFMSVFIAEERVRSWLAGL